MPRELRNHTFYRSSDGPKIPAIKTSDEYERGECARHWQMLPWEFEALPPDKQARLRAHHDAWQMIERYYTSEQNRYYDNKNKGK